MNNKKIIFVDVDQTLYDNKRQILYPSTAKILKELSTREDIDLFLATGRTCATVSHLKDVWSYFKGYIMNNGQTVIVNDKIIYERPIPKELVDKIEDYANKNNISISYVGDYDSDANFITPMATKAFNNFQIYNVLDLNKQSFDNKYNVKQFWIFADHEQIITMRKYFPDMDLVLWPGKFGCDGLLKNASKVDGIKKVIELYNYKYENTYAIGDADNDIKMFETVKTSICMGNGSLAAKQAATFVTDDIAEDGFEKGLRKALNI